MKVSASPKFKSLSITTNYPFLIYNYSTSRQEKVTIDVSVPAMNEEDFKVDMSVDGKEILLSSKVPNFFLDVVRVKMTNGNYNRDASKTVAFENLVDKVDQATGFVDEHFGPPQRIVLPFKCDTNISVQHDLFTFPSCTMPRDDGKQGDVPHEMYPSIEVESILKPRKHNGRVP